MYKHLYFNKAGDTVYNRAEGATYPETLRQKDRWKKHSGKWAFSSTEGASCTTKLSGSKTDG